MEVLEAWNTILKDTGTFILDFIESHENHGFYYVDTFSYCPLCLNMYRVYCMLFDVPLATQRNFRVID